MPRRSFGITKRTGTRGTTYRARIPLEGGRQLSRSFKTLKAAEAWRAEQMAQLHRGAWVAPSQEPFGEHLAHWLATHDLAPASRARYGEVIRRRILPTLGDVPLGRLTGRQIQELYSAARGSSEAKQLTAIINGALRLAVREGLIARNVADGLSVPRGDEPEPRPVAVWTPSEVGRFLAGLQGHRLHALFHLAAYSGMRLGELLALEWDDISFDLARLRVRQAKSPAGRRTLALDAGTLAVLRAHGGEAPQGLVFTRPDGRPLAPRTVEATMARVVAELGLPYGTPHTLRHSLATNAARAGVPLTTIQAQLGHSSYTITANLYVHSQPSDARALSEQIAALLAAPDTPSVHSRATQSEEPHTDAGF